MFSQQYAAEDFLCFCAISGTTLHDHSAHGVQCSVTPFCTLRSLSSMSNTFGLSLLRCAAGDPKPSSELKDVNDAALVSMCILSKSY